MRDFRLAAVANHDRRLALSHRRDVTPRCDRGDALVERVIACGERDVAGGLVAVMCDHPQLLTLLDTVSAFRGQQRHVDHPGFLGLRCHRSSLEPGCQHLVVKGVPPESPAATMADFQQRLAENQAVLGLQQ